MDPSKFHFFSFGVVAANKPLYDKDGMPCDMVEVFPKEIFTMSAGEVTDNVETITTKGKDADGQDYTGETKTKASLSCKWLPIHEPNRITPPDVRRDEQVMIYRYGDTQFYFWSTAFNNMIRKLETAVWWFSGTPKDGKDADKKRTADNGYFLEVSTHEKHVIFSTSNKNGEVARYYIQIDGGNGNMIIKDDQGQEIMIESGDGRISVTSEQQIIHKTKDYVINCDSYTLNCKTSVVNASESAETNTKEFTVKATSKTTFTTPIATFSGKVDVALLLSFSGGMSGKSTAGGGAGGATIQIQGNANFTEDVVAGGKSLVLHTHRAQGANAPTTPPL